MARIIDESFEGAGYENSWSETVGSGNTLDEDAGIPGTPPSGSGSQSLQAILAGSNPDAYSQFDRGSNEVRSYIRAYIYIDAAGEVQTSTHPLFSLRAAASVDLLSFVYRYTEGNGHHFRFEYYDSGTQVAGIMTSLSLDIWYRVEALYDSTGNAWEFRVDGDTKFSGALGNARVDARFLRVGPIGNKTDGITVNFDLVGWDTDDWIGPEAAPGGIVVLRRRRM